jgi:ABC-type transport system involved in multi-copper enzyme maturation permease subunit
MNALVRKEIRLILPGWIAAMILAIAPAWFVPRTELELWRKGDSGYWMLSIWLAFGLLFPALASFGQEFTLGTFSDLLAQPVARNRIWRLKLGVLTAAALAALVAALLSFLCRFGGTPVVWLFALSSILLIVVALSGGWWTTLLLRQIVPALLFAVFIPFLLTICAVGLLLGNVANEVGMACLVALLAIYAVAGFVAARKLFWNAQDSPWLGELVSLPRLLLWAPSKAMSAVKHKARPLRAMLRKEFQLQQVTLILAAAMAVLHLVDLAVRKLCVGYISANPATRGIVEVVPLLWLLLPVAAGSVMVAEERKLGTLESQLCAPISRRWQFAFKLAMALGLGLLFGGIAPIALEHWGHLAGVRGGTDQLTVQRNLVSIETVLISASLGISLLAFYASTLSRNTLQALGMTVAISAVFAFFIGLAADPPRLAGRPLWGIPLADWFGVPLAIVTVVALAWSNYGHLHFGARIWRRNVVALLGAWAVTVGADSMIFNRVWEAWMPDEPIHDWHDKFRPLAGRAKVTSNWGRSAVITPDGRLWIGRERSGFVAGSNWIDAAVSLSEYYAVKADGSLWDVSGTPKPFLAESRWRAVVSHSREFVGLKTDGSLWSWGMRSSRQGQTVMAPWQVGTETNWTLISGGYSLPAAAKADGSIWRWGEVPIVNSNNIWTYTWVATPQPWVKLHGRSLAGMSLNWEAIVVLAGDGTLWMNNERAKPAGELARLGVETNWAAACVIESFGVAALKVDGTLWRIRQRYREGHFEQERMSDYPVWAGVGWGGFASSQRYENTALAYSSDGALCQWSMPLDWEWPNPLNDDLLMAPSRLNAVKVADLNLPSN